MAVLSDTPSLPPRLMQTLLQNEPLEQNVVSAEQACIHCGEPVLSPYCGQCGQRRKVVRISWKSLMQELGSRWLGFDNQFARTFADLSIRPGRVVNRFLAGDRVSYLGPFGYYLIVTAVVILLISILDVSMEDLMRSNNESLGVGGPHSSNAAEMQAKFLHYVALGFRFIAIAMLPFFGLALKWIYRSKKLNFVEFSAILLYSVAHTYWLSLAQAVAFKFTGNSYTLVAFFLMLPYNGFFLMDILENRRSFKNWLRGVWAYMLGYLIFMAFIMVVSLIIGIGIGIYMAKTQG